MARSFAQSFHLLLAGLLGPKRLSAQSYVSGVCDHEQKHINDCRAVVTVIKTNSENQDRE